MEDRTYRIVVSKEEDMFVAQCLEHDISVQAPDMATLQRRLAAVLLTEMADGGLDHIEAAPEEYHQRWNDGLALESNVDNTEFRLAA